MILVVEDGKHLSQTPFTGFWNVNFDLQQDAE
jgi:hypothetical protein